MNKKRSFFREYGVWIILGAFVILTILGLGITIAILNWPKPTAEISKQAETVSEKAVVKDEVEETIVTDYYDISGSTIDELNQQMTEKGPDCGDHRCYAYTTWSIDWIGPGYGSKCDPVAVTLNVGYQMPRWINKDQANLSLQNDWDAYQKKLQAHETNHRNIALKHAQNFLQKVKEINSGDYQTCRELGDKISQYWATGEIVNACSQESEKYDIDSDHGVNEGISL